MAYIEIMENELDTGIKMKLWKMVLQRKSRRGQSYWSLIEAETAETVRSRRKETGYPTFSLPTEEETLE